MKTSASRKLEKLAEQFAPFIRDAFLSAVQDISDRAILSEIVKNIEAGDINAAIRSLGISDATMRPLIAEIERAFEVGGVTTGQSFPKRINTPTGRTVFRFDVRNSRAEAQLRDHSSKLVVAITEDMRTMVRQTVQRGMADGRNPKTTALDLVGRVDPVTKRRVGGVIGLTPNRFDAVTGRWIKGQEQWVVNARRDLETLDPAYLNRARRDKRFDSIVEKAIKDGKPLSQEKIDQLIGRYNDNLLKYRADVIARTESVAALNTSEHEAINQAVDQGMIRQSQVKRVWDSAGNDGRTRETHLEMEGQKVGLNEPFTFPDGTQAMFPGDTSLGAPASETIQCRCVARTVIDWLDNSRDAISDDDRDALLALSDDELFGGR